MSKILKASVVSYGYFSGAASSISEGAIFTYSCSGQLSSFEIDLISKELNCPEHEYMNMAPSLIEVAAPLGYFGSVSIKAKKVCFSQLD